MEKYQEIDVLIRDLYDSISGPKGQERKWDQLPRLFFPTARLIRTILDEQGVPQAQVMDIESYIKITAPLFQTQGFFECEIARQTDVFGNIAHLMSTYEARYAQDDPEPFRRGINSIQLFYDGSRWWIMNMLWDNEREDNPLPEKYLSQKPE